MYITINIKIYVENTHNVKEQARALTSLEEDPMIKGMTRFLSLGISVL